MLALEAALGCLIQLMTTLMKYLRPVWMAAGLVVLTGWVASRELRHHDAPPPMSWFGSWRAPQCDVVVVGSTTAGIAASLAAAERGAHVVMVDEHAAPAPDITATMLNMFDVPTSRGSKIRVPIQGIFDRVYRRLGIAFDLRAADRLFREMIKRQPRLDWRPRTRVKHILKQNNTVVGVELLDLGTGAVQRLYCSVLVDATPDATIAARAGVDYYLGRENANPDARMQSVGQLFSLKKVDWKALVRQICSRRMVTLDKLRRFKRLGREPSIDIAPTVYPGNKVMIREGGVVGPYAWERGDMLKGYHAVGPHVVCLSINFGLQDDGSVVLNVLNLVGVNGLDPVSVRAAQREARVEIPHLIKFFRTHVPGLRNAELDRIAPELYVRETRHIHGYYTLRCDDIRQGVHFYDSVAVASYPLDLHPYVKGQLNPFGPERYVYTLPLRCLVPFSIDGLFVASRSLSATYTAAGSARVIPVTMAAGEAAGVAAWVCHSLGLSPHQLVENVQAVRLVQRELKEHGVNPHVGQAILGPGKITA